MRSVVAQGVRASTPSDISQLIKEAQETCKENPDKECAAAWDEVEELSAEAAHQKARAKANPASTDPLEKFCEDNPETDECRVYED
ncbi:hypothetical protein KFL_003510120 [Klebsormidium nitens]|uniref:CP12 domain-containing protein n=1 Tax=Klebsormidium nitens TaxID=105231 RepID=A0A1Y1IGZ9_KLENI|nr:hypothetical protein KFL_003510120 [Klebsormidium nitens]|eukprot:GAQ87418.1 hypothetical protein KFL_003510120 [Klebsormidium nitens]